MAVSSMFTEHIARDNDTFEPQRQHQGLIEINIGNASAENLIELALNASFLPTLTSEEITINYLNDQTFVAGKNIPQSGNITIIDYIDEDAQQLMYNWRKQVYDPDTGFVGAAVLYKKTANIILISPDGQKTRAWELQGIWPKSIEFGSINMESNDTNKITLELRYDKARYVGLT